MKIIPFALLLLIISQLNSDLMAQTEKGRWTIGTQIGSFSYQNQNDYKSFSGSLTPSAGYFVTNGLAIGTGVPLSLSTQKNGSNISYLLYKSTATVAGLAPYVRYYFGTTALKPYLGVSYSYSLIRGKTNQNDVTGTPREATTKGHATALVPTAGLAYFFNRTLALTGGLSYNITQQKQQTDYTTPLPNGPAPTMYNNTSKSVSLVIGLQIFLGK